MAKIKASFPENSKLKTEYEFPESFILKCDSREQVLLFSKPPKNLLIVRDTLKTGDYSIKGMESVICVEKKELGDFYNSIGKERERFKRELDRMTTMEWAGLVILADEETILKAGSFYTALHPEQIRGSLVSIEIKYGVHVYYAKKKEDAERWILDRLLYFYKQKRKI